MDECGCIGTRATTGQFEAVLPFAKKPVTIQALKASKLRNDNWE